MSADTGDRTYEPTEQRKEQFRKQGRFAKARDIGGVIATAAVVGAIVGTQERLGQSARNLFEGSLGDLDALERLGPGTVLAAAATSLLALSGVAIGAAVVSAVAVSLAQSRFKTYSELLMPDLNRLNPAQGLSRLFSPKRAFTESLVAVLRVVVVGAVAWHALSKELPLLTMLARVSLRSAIPSMLGALGRIAGMSTGALLLVAAVDYAQSFFTLSKEMKMTRKEVEEESKQSDGDPKQKAKMKARARANARKRAMNAVKTADVVVTNPTHFAVALRYSTKDPAPVVIAKGTDDFALKIRAEARKHGIPILENRKLARALYAEVQLGRQVPAAHFAAVARVLAFVYKLRKRRI